MTSVTCQISVSLDGFVAGPDQSLEHPLGVGGTDGGLIGSFALFGAPIGLATAAVLGYRVFQLGLPVVLGAVSLLRIRMHLADESRRARVAEVFADFSRVP